MKPTKILLKKILDEQKISKYRITKLCDVSWTTVQFWYKGVFEANGKHTAMLEKIYKENKNANA